MHHREGRHLRWFLIYLRYLYLFYGTLVAKALRCLVSLWLIALLFSVADCPCVRVAQCPLRLQWLIALAHGKSLCVADMLIIKLA